MKKGVHLIKPSTMRNTLHYIVLIALICSFSSVRGQKVKAYKAWVTLNDETKVRGILYAASEDGLIVLDKDLADSLVTVDATTIVMIKVRKKGNVGKGVLIGTAGGAALGAILGLAGGGDEDDCYIWCFTAEEYALMGAVTLALPGAGVGALIGSSRKKFGINQNLDTYGYHLPELQGYALLTAR
jgi:hypothetical protein